MELYKKYRPKKFKDIIGQPQTVKKLKAMVKADDVPHTILFTGPSGCGKTTLARILAKKLGCHKLDYKEINAADKRGVDDIRKMEDRIEQAPLEGNVRVFVIDECHKLTSDAQSAAFKIFEDTPEHVYFILCTTNKEKLQRPIITRSTEFVVKPLGNKDMFKVLITMIQKADLNSKKMGDRLLNKIVEASDGSPRQALVILNQVKNLETEDEMMEAIEEEHIRSLAIDIVRGLMRKTGKNNWREVAKMLRDVTKDEVETLRQIALSYANTILLNPKRPEVVKQAYRIIDEFSDTFFYSGKAGLSAACFRIIFNNE
jgi:DNA polymerase-3 subunit gamma/tau